MKVMIAEYAVGTLNEAYLEEGKAMLMALVNSFEKIGHDVIYPENIGVNDFSSYLKKKSRECDCGLVISPDEFLYGYTKILEDATINLGCPSDSVKLCADKLSTSAKLSEGGIPSPKIFESEPTFTGSSKRYVIKPRYGCASEDILISSEFLVKEGFITTELLQGDHLSVSLIAGENVLPLTINKQIIGLSDGIKYKGGIVPYKTALEDEVRETAIRTVELLGCKGYVGVDIVLGDEPYVVDVNPRPTTSIVGINRVILGEIADLILRARFGGLPDLVEVDGRVTFELGGSEI